MASRMPIPRSTVRKAPTGANEIFDASMPQRMARTLQRESKLRTALEKGVFQMFHQPGVATEDAGLRGFVAPIR